MYWDDKQQEKARSDFRAFLYVVWKEIGLPPPTPIQYDMAQSLQFPNSDREIIEGFRGVAKSFITCAFVVWCLWRNKELKVEIVSASKDRADANAVFIKRIILTVHFLAHMKATKDQRDQQNLFDVAGCQPDISPSVKSVGITGQLTGTRADILIADDVEVPGNSGTQLQRDKLGEAVKEFDAILKPGGRIIYLGTPQNEMSIYNELQQRGYGCTIWPVMYPADKKEREYYGSRLGPMVARHYDSDPQKYAGKPTEPSRFSETEIAKRRLSFGRAGFALQFMLNTDLTDQEKFPLRVSDLIVDDLDQAETSIVWSWASGPAQRLTELPCVALKGDFFYGPFTRSTDIRKYTGTMMYIDPSGRGKDETSYAITKFLNGYVFLMEVGGFRDGYGDATLKMLATKAKFWGVNDVRIEPNFGDGMFTKLILPIFKEIHPCTVEESEHSTKAKEARIIDILEPVMARHKLIVNKSVIIDDYRVYEKDSLYSLIYQMTRLCKDKGALGHDDRIEAVAGAVAFWIDQLDRDAQTGEEELLEEALEQWMDPDRGVFYIPEAPPKNLKKKLQGTLGNFLDGFFGR